MSFIVQLTNQGYYLGNLKLITSKTWEAKLFHTREQAERAAKVAAKHFSCTYSVKSIN